MAVAVDLKGQLKSTFDQHVGAVLDKFNEFRSMLNASEKAVFGKALMDEAGSVSTAAKKVGGKPGRKPKAVQPTTEEGGDKPVATATTTEGGSLKSLVLNILTAHPEGLKLAELTTEVQAAIDRGEYASEAKNLANNVGQAVHNLKKTGSIKKSDIDTKKYIVA